MPSRCACCGTYRCPAAWRTARSDWLAGSPVSPHQPCWRVAAWPPSASSAPYWSCLLTGGCHLHVVLRTCGERETERARWGRAPVTLSLPVSQRVSVAMKKKKCHLSATLAALILSIMITCLARYMVVVRQIPRLAEGLFIISTSRGPEACCTASESDSERERKRERDPLPGSVNTGAAAWTLCKWSHRQ